MGTRGTLALTAVCGHVASCAWARPGTIIAVSARLPTSRPWFRNGVPALFGERSAVGRHHHITGHLLQNTLDHVAQLGTNSAVRLERAAWQNIAHSGNSGR